MTKKFLTKAVTGLLALVLLGGCGNPTPAPSPTNTAPAATGTAQPTPGPLTRVTIALGFNPDVQFTPFYVALGKGYYRDEGLDVTFKHGIVQDLVTQLGTGTGDVNFAIVSGDEIIPARVQGIPVKYVMTWYRQYPVAAASIVGKGGILKSPADLKGKVVGAPGPYGATYIGLQALLRSAGLKLEDVKFKSIGFTQAASLAEGQVDVAMVYAANEPVQLRSQGLDVSALPVSDYAQLTSNGLATNDKTLAGNPDLVQRVVRATLKGIQTTIDQPDASFQEALKQIPELGKDPAKQDLQLQILKATIKLMQPKPGDPAINHPLGWTDAAVWNATQDALFDFHVIPQKGDINEMITNRFVEK